MNKKEVLDAIQYLEVSIATLRNKSIFILGLPREKLADAIETVLENCTIKKDGEK